MKSNTHGHIHHAIFFAFTIWTKMSHVMRKPAYANTKTQIICAAGRRLYFGTDVELSL